MSYGGHKSGIILIQYPIQHLRTPCLYICIEARVPIRNKKLNIHFLTALFVSEPTHNIQQQYKV